MPGRANDSESLESMGDRLRASPLTRRLIALALVEDLGIEPGGSREARRAADVSTWACGDSDAIASGVLASREAGVVSGLVLASVVMSVFDAALRFEPLARDGQPIVPGQPLARISGSRTDLLAVERTLLNLLGRLSGVATRAQQFVHAIPPGSRARIFDTRKTTPGLRGLEKYAVRCGGASSHRMGLHDAVLIKDNHLSGVGIAGLGAYVANAAARARARIPGVFVEVEVDSLEQFAEILKLDPGTIDAVLLDNMPLDDVREAARRREEKRPALSIEASGGVTIRAVPELARAGVDRISTGAITHHAAWLDIGLDFHDDPEPGLAVSA